MTLSMTKQETVIKICKLTRITGEIKYKIDFDGYVDFASFVPELFYIDRWTDEICEYVKTDSCPRLAHLISNMGFNDYIEAYIQSHREDIMPAFQKIFDSYFAKAHELFSLCEQNSMNRKGEYINLIEPLATKQVAELLNRAVNAGLLGVDYQPIPGIKALHLKLIAYAVSTICGFKQPYTFFEKQWNRTVRTRISTCKIPRYSNEFESTKALYPEVDFSKIEISHDVLTFYVTQNRIEIESMYNDLVKHGYIAPDTSLETFNGIVGKSEFASPVKWIKGQRQLAFFIHLAFGKYNNKDLWIKGECCFTINGKVPHKDCFTTGYSYIKRAGLMDNYDIKLKTICDKFNHIETPTTQIAVENKHLIHTSKSVFFSPKTENKRKEMYSALLAGEYISPDTTYATFNGILEESDFTEPVVWLKTQNLLIYFVYMAFKEDNPYDLWVKCVSCFRFQNGKVPNRSSLVPNCRLIMQQNNPYNIELKKIADDYNESSKNSAEISETNDKTAHNINN